MQNDPDFTWDLIGHDPVLRLELAEIEKNSGNEDVLVGHLLEFFSKIEKMIFFTEEILEERQ